MSCRLYEGGGPPAQWLVEAAILRSLQPHGLLFLCVANSARSQLAEGIARSLAPEGVWVGSAGSEPSTVRPEAALVLAELGIDISTHRAKGFDAIDPSRVEAVVTLCAEEVCPIWLDDAPQVHWGLPDPAVVKGEERLGAFRHTRDVLLQRLTVLLGGP